MHVNKSTGQLFSLCQESRSFTSVMIPQETTVQKMIHIDIKSNQYCYSPYIVVIFKV